MPTLVWTRNTDDSLGGASTEWEVATSPYDTITSLSEDEAIIDPSQAYTEDADPYVIGLMTGILIYVISHLNQQNNSGGSVLPIRLRTIPIDIPPVPIRIKKKITSEENSEPGGGSD